MPRRAPPGLIRLGLLVATFGGALDLVGGPRAQAGDADAPPPATPRTRLEAGVLPRAEVVVIGRIRVLVPPRGMGSTTVVRVEVERLLKGTADATFTLFVGGSKSTDDPKRPSEPWFPAGGHGRYALFLTPSPNGSGFGLTAAFGVDDAEGREKAGVLERELVVGAIADEAKRGRALVDLMLDLLGSDEVWTRLHATRELESIVAQAPALVGPAARQEIEAIARRVFDEVLRGRLRKVVAAAEAAPTEVDVPTTSDGEATARATRALSPEYHRAMRLFPTITEEPARLAALSELARLGGAGAGPDLLVVLRDDPAAAVRERAAVLLGDVQFVPAATPLRAAYDAEATGAVREAILRAVGCVGDDTDVAWLAAVRADPALARPVAFALARIRTDAALAALADVGKAAREATPPDDALARLVEYLRTEAFVEAERIGGRAVGPRLRRAPSTTGPAGRGRRAQDPTCPAPEGVGPR